MIIIFDLNFFKKNKYSKKGINYSLFLLFLGTLLVCSVNLVPELSKRLDYPLIKENSKLIYQNPINRFVPSDTIKQLKSEEYLRTLEKDKFKGGRTAHWYYGWIIFKDYPSYNKIVGGGFDYLELYGKKFGAAKYDWPHNPLISAFLYSGILGGLAFIWFIIMVIINYLLYLKRHLFFFVSFVVTFFFVFFSDTSLFNTPLFTFLCLVPFFTKYLYLKEKYNDSQKIPFKKILFW